MTTQSKNLLQSWCCYCICSWRIFQVEYFSKSVWHQRTVHRDRFL